MNGPRLVSSNPDPKKVGCEGVEWHCQGCGCTILQGHLAGVRVRKGELNLDASSCHTSDELRCAGCKKVAAMKVDDRWKILT